MWPRDEQRAAQALDRYLQGERVTTIASDLHRDPSTVRRWLADQLAQLAREDAAARVEQLQAAIETQRATAREAWRAYHREQARADAQAAQAASPESPRPAPNHAHIYLRLALIAQREVARLQGLYTRNDPPPDGHVSITITRRPDGPENLPPPWYNSDGPSTPSDNLAQTAQTAQTPNPVEPPEHAARGYEARAAGEPTPRGEAPMSEGEFSPPTARPPYPSPRGRPSWPAGP